MIDIRSLLSISILLLVTACGGSGGSPVSNPKPTMGPETINGIVVPPDPGAAKDATLAGIDTDHNGIRDEIDRWIATQYGDKPGALEAIRMNAKGSQKLMMSTPSTKEQALAIAYESMDLGGCTGNKLREEGINASNFWGEEMLRTYNTKDRLNARKNVFSLAGMIVRNVGDTTINCPYK